ncbi:hypothetical protein MPH48_18550 [Lysinibacillus fusiformis]|uniref:hypothetical protein n=1 Tax=Lysinibacillus fusiformis TaxID=28031 RepID=UPI001F4DF1CA|nr:hypothetical protein [Lysinibacillus fusiformis]MCK1990088.1 hypothetical protein [Lysinibacillus fusiformis]
MVNFKSFRGVITQISDFPVGQNADRDGCYKMMSVEDGVGGVVNFVISPSTYFVNQEVVTAGEWVTGYYDGDAPVPMIYPPQYRALIVVKESNFQNVKVDFFNQQLVSSDGQLHLNLSPSTVMSLKNGQPFTKSPANRNLIVMYGPTTRSIPAQTTPYEIIVWC